MGFRESALAESTIEVFKHLGAVGATESLMEIVKHIPEEIAHAGALPAAGAILSGLAGGPLAWGVVLVGGCLLHCRHSRCNSEQAQEVFHKLYRKLHDVELAIKKQQSLQGLLDELLGQNLALRSHLEKNEPFIQAFQAAAEETANDLGLEVTQFRQDVQVYLSNLSDWISQIQATVENIKSTQATALTEQRDADKTTHKLLNGLAKKLGSNRVNPLIDQLSEMKAVSQQLTKANDYFRFVKPAFKEFHKIHRWYILKHRKFQTMITDSTIDVRTVVEEIEKECLFSTATLSRLRAMSWFEKDCADSDLGHDKRRAQFFKGIHMYLTLIDQGLNPRDSQRWFHVLALDIRQFFSLAEDEEMPLQFTSTNVRRDEAFKLFAASVHRLEASFESVCRDYAALRRDAILASSFSFVAKIFPQRERRRK